MTCKSCNIKAPSRKHTVKHTGLDKKIHDLRMKIICTRNKLAKLHHEKRIKRAKTHKRKAA